MQKWFDWLNQMKKEDEVEKMEEEHQKKVSNMIKKCRWKCRAFAQDHQLLAWRGGMLKKEEEDGKP